MNEEDFKNKKETYIDFLKSDAALQLNWAQKKEVAVWTATVFYVGVIYAFFRMFFSDTESSLDNFEVIIVWSFSGLLLIAISTFIWSNFQSIYYSHAYYNAVKKLIPDIIGDRIEFNFQNSNSQIYINPDFVQDELDYRLKTIQKNQTRWRPLKIVVCIGFNFFLSQKMVDWINEKLPTKLNITVGAQLARQEAVMYLIIFLSTILFWIYLYDY